MLLFFTEKSIPEEEESTSSLLSGKLTSSLTTDVDTSSNDASQVITHSSILLTYFAYH